MYKTCPQWIDFRADSHPHRIALHFEEREYTYLQMREFSRRAASFLLASGLSAGDRFAILEQNTPELYFLILGASLKGIIPVVLNWRLSAGEIELILSDCGAKALFYGKEFLSTAKNLKIFAEKKARSFEEIILPDFAESAEPSAVRPADAFGLLYTSGTTGSPRGVIVSHANVSALALQLILDIPGFGAEARNLVCAPNFHISGLGYFLTGYFAGAENFLLRKFESSAVENAVDSQRITHALLVPAMMQALIAAGGHADYGPLRHILYGASPISGTLLRQAKEKFSCDFTQAYGLTETTGVATLLRCDDHRAAIFSSETADEILSSAGRPAFGMAVTVLRDDGSTAEPGEIGEVCVRGDTVFSGYWNVSSEKYFSQNGFLRTGDIGRIDTDGYLFLLDRLNDLIISKGEKIYPIEVERILSACPGIKDAAVFGIPDDEFGEAVCAAVVALPGTVITMEEINSWARTRIAPYKLPRRVVFLEQLPRNASGKVLRRDLSKPYWQDVPRNIN